MVLISRIARWWEGYKERVYKKTLGKFYHDCPVCKAVGSLRWVQDYVYHPEEPPCFGHWYCRACGGASKVVATKLMDEAARNYGYKDFETFYKERGKKGAKDEG